MTQSNPAISVIVPAWGVAHLVGEALASLRAQSFTDWEAIIVDDGAPDDVAGAVAPFVAMDPRIRFLPTSHGGVAAARNQAIARARAPLIALLDGDDVYLPTYLETMRTAIEADAAIGLVTCDAFFTGQPSREGKRFSRYSPQSEAPTLDAVIARRSSIFIASLMRREALRDAGPFDQSLRSAEDFDMWIRILSAGWRAVLVKEPLVMYRRRPDSLSAATLDLTKATLAVYQKAQAALANQPEGCTALAMARQTAIEIAWMEAENLVLDGETEAGLAALRRAHVEQRGHLWRLLMGLFRLVPPVAKPVLAWRRRQWVKA